VCPPSAHTLEPRAAAASASAADVSVVVCAYDHDRWADLEAAVASVRAQTVPAREIIVVIDHNPRLLALARANLPGVLVLENVGAQGAGEARNTGVAAASGSIVAFLDDDARASGAWIANAIEALADPAVMGVGGTIEPAWDEQPPAWFPREFNWVVGCTYPGLPELPAPVRNLISANMFVRRSTFDQLGGFRAGFGKQEKRSRPEETDLCLRANQRFPRHVWLYHPDVVVRHRVPPGRGSTRYFISRCYNEGAGKAALVDFVGGEGVAAERVYTRRTLPKGFAGGVGAALRGDPSGIARSSAIVFGLGVTVAGYAVEKLRLRLRRGGE
jgi:hypothetical protein